MSDFTHLHTHSHYSLLNALPKIKELVSEAKKQEMKALALTDNCNLYGAIEFYQKCLDEEIKPIIGIDAYLSLRSMEDKQAGVDKGWNRLILLAKNIDGYRNIIKLVTEAHLRGFYYKPRIDKETLEKYSKDIVCISPSFSGDIVSAIKNHDTDKARDLLNWYKNIFKDDFYIEITHHPEIAGHEDSMKDLISFAKENAIKIVAAHDVYYINPEDRAARETLLSVQNNNPKSSFDDEEEDFSFITKKKAAELFRETPEALESIGEIVDKCNLEITLGQEAWKFPDYIIESGLTHDEELKKLAYEGLSRRGMELNEKVEKRVEYELEVIKNKGYSKYFLVVADLLKFAKENHILSNTRGSAAGSLVSYLIGITIVDPIALNLPFERFLNPDRPSAPDIDMDFADDKRDEVIEYARRKYGKDHVAQIGTFGTMLARGSVRDTARALGYSYNSGDRIAKLIPMGAQGFPMTIDRALDEVPELKDLYKKDEEVKTIIDMARKIEGCARHIGVHAAGVVISPRPLTEDVPVQFDPKGSEKLITQYDMHAVGEDGVGLLKFDFLGLKNLTIMGNTIKLARKVFGEEIDVDKISLDDKKTYEMLARGETAATFQLNGSGMTRFLKELKPTTIHDINAMVALYRPGPLDFIPNYIDRKHNPHKIKYLDPRLEHILDQSYGVITYQDDVMMIAIELGGYSWIEADKLRKAMGKKIPELMAEQKDKFFKGCKEVGKLEEKKIQQLWDQIETFAAYGFNKCITGDTLINDAETGKPIKVSDLYKGNKRIKVESLDKSLNLVKAPISTVMENGKKNVYLLQTRSGREIETTDNHPFYTFDGWKELRDIKLEEKIATKKESSLYWDEVVSITPQGKKMTYDITVPDYHNFVANNIIVHNSHAASYGRIAYLTSYLKANYPVLYMTSVLTADQGDVDKVAEMIGECKRMDIEVLPPNINESFEDFATVGKERKIRFGLTTIKNFGEGIAHTIIEERKANGKFNSISDFLNRIRDRNLNKKSLEALIKCGALDEFGERGSMLESLEKLLEYNKELQKTSSDQDSLFGATDISEDNLVLEKTDPATMEDKLSWEKELLGLYISGHPLDKYKEKLEKNGGASIERVFKAPTNTTVICAGLITNIREIFTKKGDKMAFITLSDYNGGIEAVAFPKAMEEYGNILQSEKCVVVKGKVNERNGEKSILIDKVKELV
ncbi:MAG: DNA polymerase III subunit alpha [Candidatus Pacebacteria bacterium]|nr:DNA polymerase III subunit alpha [Candidatus Paceibacterota bacterium]